MPNPLQKMTNRRGQHVMEYSIVLIITMVAMMIALPHVMRGWNANMKGWEDSAIDSLEDPLLEAPVVTSLPGCACNWSMPLGCGNGSCSRQQMASQCICNPPGCGSTNLTLNCTEGTYQCPCDSTCCEPWQPTGLCGAAANPPCLTGEMRKTRLCGCNPTPQSQCLPDPACTFACQGINGNPPGIDQPLNSQECPNYESCLSQNRRNVLVDACSGGCDHCEYICTAPFFANNNQCTTCPIGKVFQGVCTTGQCQYTTACSGGTCQTVGAPPPLPPPTCGTNGLPCCTGNVCNAGLLCSNGTCIPCGNPSEACCTGSVCFSSTCINGTCVCGDPGQSCCAGGVCNSGLSCNSSYLCSCGDIDEDCCSGGTCNGALQCNGVGKCCPITYTGYCSISRNCCEVDLDCPPSESCVYIPLP